MTRSSVRRVRRVATTSVGVLAMFSFTVALGVARHAGAAGCVIDGYFPECYDANPCTKDNGHTCGELFGVNCDNDPVADGTPCPTPAGTCAAPGSASRCVNGHCTPWQGSPPCPDDHNPCTYNRCEAKGCTGPHSYPKKPSGTMCKDFKKSNGVVIEANDCTTSGHTLHASTCNTNGICGSCRTGAGCSRVAGPWGGALKYCRPDTDLAIHFDISGELDDGDPGCQ